MPQIHIVSRSIELDPEHREVSAIGAFSDPVEAARVAEEMNGLQVVRDIAEAIHARIWHWVRVCELPV